MAEDLKINKRPIYRILRRLESKEIVTATPERPIEFSAVPFDRALEILIKAHLKASQNIERERKDVLRQWHSMMEEQSNWVEANNG